MKLCWSLALLLLQSSVLFASREFSWKNKLRLRSAATDTAPRKSARVVDGTVTNTDVYEWMVAFSARSTHYALDLFCGGSLIRNTNPPIVLTAAHCIDGLSDSLFQQTGETFTFYATLSRNNVEDNAEVGYITIPWDDYVYHSDYDPNTVRNDIALVKLQNNSAVENQNEVNLYTNTMEECCNQSDIVRVLGYGAQETNQSITGTLEYADLTYIPREICNKWFYLWITLPEDERETYDYSSVDWSTVTASVTYIYPGMICAFAEDQDSCQGDSGGPLINGASAESDQIGVVSWGVGCADELPGVYSSVGYFHDWIEESTDCLLKNTCRASGAIQVTFWLGLFVAFGSLFWIL